MNGLTGCECVVKICKEHLKEAASEVLNSTTAYALKDKVTGELGFHGLMLTSSEAVVRASIIMDVDLNKYNIVKIEIKEVEG